MRAPAVLDRDLDRIANAESAGLHSARPVLRLGAALIFAALATAAGATLAGDALPGGAPTAMLVASGLVAAFLALSIGANDVANALGPAVGAGALRMGAGLIAVGTAEIAGALLAGGRVSQTLSVGILPPGLMLTGAAPGTVMLAAMLAAAIWIALATWAGAPVSTTHAVVGGIAGAGIAMFGPAAVAWGGVLRIAAGWIASPLLAGLLAGALLALLRRKVHRAPDRAAAARRWLPPLVALMAAALVLQGLSPIGAGPVPTAALVALAALGVGIAARRRIIRDTREGVGARKLADRLFGPPLAAAAVLMGFAHGANDAGNVAAPLAVIARAALSGGSGAPALLAPWALALAGAGIALGAVLFGRRLVRMVGTRITRLNPARALCVALATALTVIAASRLGLPVSTTHVAVGGVFGVGFYREWEERRHRARIDAAAGQAPAAPLPVEERRRLQLVRRAAVIRTLAAWAVTVPAAGGLAAAIALALG